MTDNLMLTILVTVVAILIVFVAILLKIIISSSKQNGTIPLSYKQMGAFSATLENVERVSQHIKEVIRNIESRLEERKRFDELNQEMMRRIDHIISGTKTKGLAGENIVSETLKHFPSDMVVRNYKLKNKEVEFGLVLSDGKVVPIDSKWPSSDNLDKLADEEDIGKRQSLINSIQRDVRCRIQEVSAYIDSEKTAPLAICTVPDAVYSVSPNLHPFAYKKNVVLVSYSLLLPYLLTLYHLHLQYSRDYDIENLTHYLMDIRRRTDELNDILENKIIKSSVMLTNAIDQYRQILGSIRNSLFKITDKRKS
ncbi:MAG TPA: DNA recombination protein RmuC [Candidatus Omnitrophica bacterium]|nr:DNA recombination protein RmuC [Candidatus Omnitrophota bacterium]